ncbi:hypothetical protein QYM36_004796 [Artemia franciscana]|uniref:DUF4371 domain-containing protein n=1 Tax=Artemia franciscana TaxID=6661 RepID=A0AA88I668_ARTSF|nr:hypothetical protein QYM36_004796 [Artemia franciscana]
MVKAAESKSDLYLALLEYQNIPVDGFAPAQIMVGRQLRSLLPSITQTLQPGAFQFDQFRQQREKAQEAQSKHYNQHARNVEPLKMGQKVWVQLTDQGTWKKATVCKTGNSPHSYYVYLKEGGTFCHNRINIKSRQDPMVTDLHNGASCQVKTLSISPSKNVPNPLADSQETTDPPTVESPTPKQGVTHKEVEATDPAQAEQINHGRRAMATHSGCQVKPPTNIAETVERGAENIPLRGHREDVKLDNQGPNVVAAENDGGDSLLQRLVETAPGNAKYTSKQIQNELIGTIGELIKSETVRKVNTARVWCLIADESTDRKTRELLVVACRYVYKSEKGYVIREDPVAIFDAFQTLSGLSEDEGTNTSQNFEERLDGKSLGRLLLSEITKFGLDMTKCIGQGYDKAASMSSLQMKQVTENRERLKPILEASLYSITFDETTDVSHSSQLSLALCYAFDNHRCEDFIGSVDVHHATFELSTADKEPTVNGKVTGQLVLSLLEEMVISDLKSRFSRDTLNSFRLTVLLPSNIVNCTDDLLQSSVKEISSMYGQLFGLTVPSTRVILISAEVHVWRSRWLRVKREGGIFPSSVEETAKECDTHLYPYVRSLLDIYISSGECGICRT